MQETLLQLLKDGVDDITVRTISGYDPDLRLFIGGPSFVSEPPQDRSRVALAKQWTGIAF